MDWAFLQDWGEAGSRNDMNVQGEAQFLDVPWASFGSGGKNIDNDLTRKITSTDGPRAKTAKDRVQNRTVSRAGDENDFVQLVNHVPNFFLFIRKCLLSGDGCFTGRLAAFWRDSSLNTGRAIL